MNFWIERNDDAAHIGHPFFVYCNPGGALSRWRTIKLERGLVRHPSAEVHVPACRALLELGRWGQDECWETLSESDRAHLHDSGARCCSADDIAKRTRRCRNSDCRCGRYRSDRENRRMLTAVSNGQLRSEFCRLYEREYPGDPDTGCPADQPPPATIVTGRGDVPLIGPWPR